LYPKRKDLRQFSPEVTTVEDERSLREQSSLKRLVCTTLKTKCNPYASFHVSVNEDDFPFVNNTGLWLNGCLIAPFHGKLTPDQVRSSSTPVKTTTVDAPPATNVPPAPEDGSDPLIMVLDNCDFYILYQNVRGLRTKCSDSTDNVFAKNFKVYCIKETWLIDSILGHKLFPDSHSVFRADRDYLTSNTERGGGVLAVVSKSFQGLNGDIIWKLLMSVCGLQFLFRTIAIYS
jgi:hypothetical protein